MSLLVVALLAFYGVVALGIGRYAYSEIAHSWEYRGSERYENGDYYSPVRPHLRPGHPEWRPCYGVALLLSVPCAIGWPLLMAYRLVRWARPWRLLTWLRSPAEKRWLVEEQRRVTERAEKELGIAADAEVKS